jgi:glyoxylase-like metal-dependent hydrolase (beta-lactamase superfamily II)
MPIEDPIKRYDWMILQKGMMRLSAGGFNNPFSEHRCTSVLLWPEDERPCVHNTVLIDPCFTKEGYSYASRVLNNFGLLFTDIGRIFTTHNHNDHQLHIPEPFPSPNFLPFVNERFPGINEIPCPGHSFDMQALVFHSVGGEQVWIVGDAILDEAWLRAWLYYWPNNYNVKEIIQTWKSMAMILSKADIIVPGHGKPIQITSALLTRLLLLFENYTQAYEHGTQVLTERQDDLKSVGTCDEVVKDIGIRPYRLQPKISETELTDKHFGKSTSADINSSDV